VSAAHVCRPIVAVSLHPTSTSVTTDVTDGAVDCVAVAVAVADDVTVCVSLSLQLPRRP
jgi:hypothetical protein